MDEDEVMREVAAVLESDLRTSGATTPHAFREAAMASIASLIEGPQVVSVSRDMSEPNRVNIEIKGPTLLGSLPLRF